jgi:hypothetical protein
MNEVVAEVPRSSLFGSGSVCQKVWGQFDWVRTGHGAAQSDDDFTTMRNLAEIMQDSSRQCGDSIKEQKRSETAFRSLQESWPALKPPLLTV